MTLAGASQLPEIPLIDLGSAGPVALLEAARDRAEVLLETGRRIYPAPVVRFGDRQSRLWLARNATPYRAEIDQIAAVLNEPGAYFLNVNYEWGCTSGVTLGEEPGEAPRLVRVLDWRFDQLGAQIVAARFEAPSGPWINLTWPGFAGCVQAMAPGRFSACYNQAPMRRRFHLMPVDWALARLKVWRSEALPPAHLLRQVFETCPDYAGAKSALVETPIAVPAIFVLSGAAPGEGCVIERMETQASVHEGPVTVANAWLTNGLGGAPRGGDNSGRKGLLAAEIARAGTDFAWLRAPILNPTTRLAMIAEAAKGRLTAVGIENERAATSVLRLEGAFAGEGEILR